MVILQKSVSNSSIKAMGADKDVEYVHLKSQIPVTLISLATTKRPLIHTIYRYRQDVLLCSVHYEKFSEHKPCEYWFLWSDVYFLMNNAGSLMCTYCFALEDAVKPPPVSFYNRSFKEDLWTQPDKTRATERNKIQH